MAKNIAILVLSYGGIAIHDTAVKLAIHNFLVTPSRDVVRWKAGGGVRLK